MINTRPSDNQRLPVNDRQAVIGSGVISFNSIQKEDAGNYKCIALAINGGRAEGQVTLNVLAPPVMSPFSFPDNLEEVGELSQWLIN